MGLIFIQYITIDEYKEVTGREDLPGNDNEAKEDFIKEASRQTNQQMPIIKVVPLAIIEDYEDNLKRAVAWQCAYLIDNGDQLANANTLQSVTMGKFTKTNRMPGMDDRNEFEEKLKRSYSMKSSEYLLEGGYLYGGNNAI